MEANRAYDYSTQSKRHGRAYVRSSPQAMIVDSRIASFHQMLHGCLHAHILACVSVHLSPSFRKSTTFSKGFVVCIGRLRRDSPHESNFVTSTNEFLPATIVTVLSLLCFWKVQVSWAKPEAEDPASQCSVTSAPGRVSEQGLSATPVGASICRCDPRILLLKLDCDCPNMCRSFCLPSRDVAVLESVEDNTSNLRFGDIEIREKSSVMSAFS